MTLETIEIADPAGRTWAKILPGVGFNCYSFEVATPGGRLETLWAAPDFASGAGKPSASGIPLLFPFAGRIRGTSFRFADKDYQLPAGDGQGNAIHGFVIGRPWRVVTHEASYARGEFQASVDAPELLAHWPSDFRIAAEYRLNGGALMAEYTIDNPGSGPLPFGFGTHPYFRVPLGGGSADACRVTVPVSLEWELKQLLPTGEKAASESSHALAAGLPVEGMKLDSVFSGVRFENHRATATIDDPQSARRLKMSFDDQMSAVVVFNPPHREAICVEPYTTVPDPFTLAARDIGCNLQALQPGKSFRTRIDIRVDPLAK